MNLLPAWRARVEEAIRTPWPGPRPMRAGRDDPAALVGRVDDSREFVKLIYKTPLVVFTGRSGVGKTSMLQVDLLPTLLGNGYKPLVVNDWSSSPKASSFDELVLGQVYEKLPPRVRVAIKRGGSLLATLGDLYPDRGVLILDQFEELIRYQPREFQRVLRWIEDAARGHVRIVISLRVEHEHNLNGEFGIRLGAVEWERFELKPITHLEHVRRVIQRGEGRSDRISPAAVNLLLEEWRKAGDTGDPKDRGLLHLQALLFVLWVAKKNKSITAHDVWRLKARLESRRAAAGADPVEPEGVLFGGALTEAVRVFLRSCSDSCKPDPSFNWPGLDAVLVDRARNLVGSIGENLSSGGYKVNQSRERLAELAILHDGVGGLRHHYEASELARTRLVASVDAARTASASRTESHDWLSITRADLCEDQVPIGRPWELDPLDTTGGVLLGLRPVDSLIEEYRSFYFALEWLTVCELVRITTPPKGQTIVSLVHDLFGDGIASWRDRAKTDASAVVSRLAAIRGVEIDWSSDGDASSDLGPIVANIRWRSCDVTAKFRGTTFVNCDFRGTRFVESTFAGVSFVNCMLDDAEFLRCEVIGSPDETVERRAPNTPSEQPSGKPPAFFVANAPKSLLKSLAWYREPRSTDSLADLGLYSQTAGLAAVPARDNVDEYAIPFEAPVGGLSLFGGRISSLKVRECDFVSGGRLALHHVAGTSVEIADQTHVNLDVNNAALRGLTITRPVQRDWKGSSLERRHELGGDVFDLSFRHSRIVNLWFGIGLKGDAVFDDCTVWQVFNAADREDLLVKVTERSGVYGPVNVEPVAGNQFADLHPDSLGTMRDLVREMSMVIDYRAHPFESELRGPWGDNPD